MQRNRRIDIDEEGDWTIVSAKVQGERERERMKMRVNAVREG